MLQKRCASHDEPTMNARNLHAALGMNMSMPRAASSIATYCSRDCGSRPPARQSEAVVRIAGQGYRGRVTYCSVVPRPCGRSFPVRESGGCYRIGGIGGTENPGVLPLLSARGAGSLALCPRVRLNRIASESRARITPCRPLPRPECFHRRFQAFHRPALSPGRLACLLAPPGLPASGSRIA